MDLGISGKWALVCGASKGLGLACAQHLSEAGGPCGHGRTPSRRARGCR